MTIPDDIAKVAREHDNGTFVWLDGRRVFIPPARCVELVFTPPSPLSKAERLNLLLRKFRPSPIVLLCGIIGGVLGFVLALHP